MLGDMIGRRRSRSIRQLVVLLLPAVAAVPDCTTTASNGKIAGGYIPCFAQPSLARSAIPGGGLCAMPGNLRLSTGAGG
jgi:hypothetical protein